MAEFREFCNDQQSAPPFFFRDVRIRSFLFEADGDRLQFYCDRILNFSDSPYHFVPLAPIVYLALDDYPFMESQWPKFAGLGYTTQHEFSFMFPVLRYKKAFGSILIPDSMSWAFPFIGVDDTSSAMTGQEVLGFQKMDGDISFFDAANGAFESDVAMPSFLTPGGRETTVDIVRVRTGPPLFGSEAVSAAVARGARSLAGEGAGGDAMSGLLGLAEGWMGTLREAALKLMTAALPGSNSVINLKQFRLAVDPSKAAYQALVSCDWDTPNVRDIRVYEDIAVDIYDNPTLPIGHMLGLVPAAGPDLAEGDIRRTRYRPQFGIGMTCDMHFKNAHAIYKAP